MDKLFDLIIRLIWIGLYCAVMLIVAIVAWRLFHAHLAKTELKPADYLESFKKLHEEGKLTAEEFRIVRQLVSLQLTQSPGEPKPDYSLLNKSSPSQPMARTSGNFPKK